jgi:hypothetical protein
MTRSLLIKHQISEHHLQKGAILIFQDGDDVTQSFQMYPSLLAVATSDAIGIPVLAIVDSDDRWSIIGTKSIGCKNYDGINMIEIDCIRNCDCPSKLTCNKGQHEYLMLRDDQDITMLI